MSASGAPSGAWGAIQRAAHRLVPSYEMEVDLVAVSRVASCSTRADWNAGVLTNVTANDRGEVALSAAGAGLVLLDTTTGGPTLANQGFLDPTGYPQEYAVDVWVDPSYVAGQPFTLGQLTLRLTRDVGLLRFQGRFRITVSTYDEQWRLTPLGDPIELTPTDSPYPNGTVVIDFVQNYGREFVIEPGLLPTRTGPGLDAAGVWREVNPIDGLSQLPMVRALSIGITPVGSNPSAAAWSVVTSQPIFDPTTFWRPKGNGVGLTKRNQGPYYPLSPPLDPATDRNLDGGLVSGAVPGYGAKSATSGQWGMARRVANELQPQGGEPWYQPYVKLTARTVQPSGTAVVVLDLEATPTNEVQFRADDWVRRGTNITYSLRGRNSTGDAWTAIGAVVDGGIVSALYRYYEVTATLTATPVSGGNGVVSPVLQAVQITERIRYRTEGLTGEIDADATVDPVTGQSSIGELALTLLRGPRDDFRDLATSIASGVSPSRLEAQVFGVCTTTNTRRFLESYRLESRTPYRDREEMRFVSGLDRLQVRVPPQVETFTFPAAGATQTVTAISGAGGVGSDRVITISGAAWSIGQLNGYRLRLLTGALAGADYEITATPATNQVTIVVPATGLLPSGGDDVEIHSDVYRRQDVVYAGQDPAAVYEDVLLTRARVPRRYLGTLPATGRVVDPAGTPLTTSGRMKASGGSEDGVTALTVLQSLAALLGGGIVWRRGLIAFVDLFTPGESVAIWDERDYETLESPTGLDRRMPSVSCKFGADPATGAYAGEVVANDLNVLAGAGRANLFDVTAVDDAIAKWCTSQDLAVAHVTRLRDAFSAGVPVWTVSLIHQYPWIDIGDVVTIMTDQYTSRIFRFSPDGLVDESIPLAGRTATVGVVIGRNLAADRFAVLARSTSPVANGSTGGGPTEGPLEGIVVPAITLAAVSGGVAVTYTPPVSPYFAFMEYDVRSRTTAGPGAWSATTRVAGTASGDDFVALTPDVDTDVEITPISVSTADVRLFGSPVIVALGALIGADVPGRIVVAALDENDDDLTIEWDGFYANGVESTTTSDVSVRTFATVPGAAEGPAVDPGVAYTGGVFTSTFARLVGVSYRVQLVLNPAVPNGTAQTVINVTVPQYNPDPTVGAFINVPTSYGPLTLNFSPTNAPAGATYDAIITTDDNGTNYLYNVTSGANFVPTQNGKLAPGGGYSTPRNAYLQVTMKTATGAVVTMQSVGPIVYHIAP